MVGYNLINSVLGDGRQSESRCDMVAQRIVKGLFSLCMVYIFVLVGTNMIRYGHETGFSSDKQMVASALNRVTTDRHVDDDAFIYLTGIDKVDEAQESYVVGIGDFFDDIWKLFASMTDVMTIMMGFSIGVVSFFEQWALSIRMDTFGHGIRIQELALV